MATASKAALTAPALPIASVPTGTPEMELLRPSQPTTPQREVPGLF